MQLEFFGAAGEVTGSCHILRWYEGIAGRPPVWLVHGEGQAAAGLRDARQAKAVRADVAVSGLALDLGAAA